MFTPNAYVCYTVHDVPLSNINILWWIITSELRWIALTQQLLFDKVREAVHYSYGAPYMKFRCTLSLAETVFPILYNGLHETLDNSSTLPTQNRHRISNTSDINKMTTMDITSTNFWHNRTTRISLNVAKQPKVVQKSQTDIIGDSLLPE